jgi:hypothetical protein
MADDPREGPVAAGARRMRAIRDAAVEWLARRRAEPAPDETPGNEAERRAVEELRGTLATVAVLARLGDGELHARAEELVERLRHWLPDLLAALATDGGASPGGELAPGLARIASAFTEDDAALAEREAARLEGLLAAPPVH